MLSISLRHVIRRGSTSVNEEGNFNCYLQDLRVSQHKKKKSLLFTKKGNILETIKNLFFAKLSPVKIAATQSHFFFSFGPLQLINFMIKKKSPALIAK